MEDLLDDIEAASAAGLHYVALWSALTIPDFCGALGYPNGIATGPRYVKWWDANLPEYLGHFPGERAWAFRCSMLHQGRALHSKWPRDRVLLMEPDTRGSRMHCVQIDAGTERARILYIPELVRDLVTAARSWLAARDNDSVVQKNLDRFVRRRPDGVAPYVVGIPLIG